MHTGPSPSVQRCWDVVRDKSADPHRLLMDAAAFQEAIHHETARALRSGRPALLVLIDVSAHGLDEMPTMTARQIAAVLASTTRETDVKGWYTEGALLGILCTELGDMRDSVDAAGETIVGRLDGSLSGLSGGKPMRITRYTLPASLVACESLPLPLTYHRREKDAVSFSWSQTKPARHERAPQKKTAGR